jgi:unsaturated chondroitin disaccharide hydrolase
MRFNERGRYLRSFLAPDSLFVDIMMNVGVIFHAASRTGDPDLARIASEHCQTTRRFLVRGDGSASHEGIFDLDSGRFLRQTTQQGWRDDGSWARGQAWALHGFGTAYRYTADGRFLATAARCADFYIERTGTRLVPPNDWEEPAPRHPWESSAAAIAAGGLWQLGCLIRDAALARAYADYAMRILMRLCQEDFLAADEPEWEGVLKHGIYHESKQLGVDESVMWGDYFFLDALHSITSGLGVMAAVEAGAAP